MNTLIKVSGATVRYMERLLFENLDFDWKEGEHWAIIGSSGAQLTAFLDTLLGRTMVTAGTVSRPFAIDYQKMMGERGEVNSFRDLMAVVSQKYTFKNKSNLQNFYYQQRFNSLDSDEANTVREFLAGLDGIKPGFWDIPKVLQFMDLGNLASESLIKLSNGESRRLAIAGALLRNPHILLMDQPMTGLDIQTRSRFDQILKGIIGSGVHVIMSTHSFEIPESITHVAVLGEKKMEHFGTRAGLQDQEFASQSIEGVDELMLGDLLKRVPAERPKEILKMENIHIQYGGKVILDGINWEVKPGEKWVLHGPNGAGKSTLISLVLGENPQAYANQLWLFGKKRGTGESIWDVKKRIGFVAPELGRFFPANQTCLKVVLSGLFDTMGLFKKVTIEQESLAKDWLALFKLSNLQSKLLRQVSLEEQRFILLARALIKNPALLVLDEASQGMDEYQRLLFKKTVEQVCKQSDLALIYVSHYQEDLPDCMDKVFELKS
jgi:molybdate transport system ATP-binding protein